MDDPTNGADRAQLHPFLRPLWFLFNLSSDVDKGETGRVAVLLVNVFLILVAYYIIKTVREPLILSTGGADLKSYAAGVQAAVLMGLLPVYGWATDRVDRLKLIGGLTAFFIGCIQIFFALAQFETPYLGFAFYVWVGIFSLSVIAQFWSYANDLYDEEAGERLFPVIAIGATAGAPVGSYVAGTLFDAGISPYAMLQVSAVLLVVQFGLYLWAESMGQRGHSEPNAAAGDDPFAEVGGFKLILENRYLWLIALFLILLNLVNTTGEYVLSKFVVNAAEAAVTDDPSMSKSQYIGVFYGDFFFWVNIITVVVQAFLVSRLVKYLGIAGVVFALPVVAVGTYGAVGAGLGFAVFKYFKMAENSTDYSVMNTAKALLWLPTTKEEQYKAKQAVDTFFVRLGDVLSALVVFVGTTYLNFGPRSFGMFNLVVIAAWMGVGYLIVRRFRELVDTEGLDQMRDQQ